MPPGQVPLDAADALAVAASELRTDPALCTAAYRATVPGPAQELTASHASFWGRVEDDAGQYAEATLGLPAAIR